MTGVLLDTHAWVWTMDGSDRLSGAARAAIADASDVAASAVSFYEIVYKVRLRKWPEMEARADDLERIASDQVLSVLALDHRIAMRAARLDWPHRDPFDRFIAATALGRGLTVVTRDDAFRTLPGLRTVW